jgi:hypothetical protein
MASQGSLCRKTRPPLSFEAVNYLFIKEFALKGNEKLFKEDIATGHGDIAFTQRCFHVIGMPQGGK